MNTYRITQIVEETYYIEAENEDDAMARVYSGEADPCNIEEIGIIIIEVTE